MMSYRYKYLLVIPFVFSFIKSNLADFNHNFIQTIRQADGELITKVHYEDVSAIQTSVGGYSLIQLTNATELIQLWFSNGELVDCEFDDDVDSINNLLNQFQRPGRASRTRCSNCSDSSDDELNMTVTLGRINNLPPELSLLNSTELLVRKCSQLHERILSHYKHNLGTKTRSRRALFPGTNWCGSGSTSKGFSDLGHNMAADRCCRDHDHCKHTIAPFTTKYRLFNYRFHTVSHCDCDERFKSCLKRANTGATNLVGKLFFNVVQTKCFTFKRQVICKKRSWWGKCLRTRKARTANFRNGLAY